MNWDLFVDESGKFEDTARKVSVSGVLVERSPACPTNSAVENVFREAYSAIPLPHHSCDLDLVAGQLAAWVVSGRPTQSPLFGKKAVKVLQAFRTLEDWVRDGQFHGPAEIAKRFESYRSKLARGEWPTTTEVQASRRFLERVVAERRSYWLLAAAGAVADEYFRRLRRGLEALMATSGGTVNLVAAGEGPDQVPFVRPGGVDDLRDPEFQDRYLCSLEVLVERALALLRDADGAADHLRVHVSYRHVEDCGKMARMTRGHVRATLRRASEFAWPVGHGGPRVVLGAIQDYGPGADPWFAVADFIAGRVNRGLSKQHQSWSSLGGWLKQVTGVGADVPCRHLASACPGIAASGATRRALVATFDSDHELAGREINSVPRSWLRSQAEKWIDTIKRHQGGKP